VSAIALTELTIAQAKTRMMTQTPTLFTDNHPAVRFDSVTIPSSNNGGFFLNLNNSIDVSLGRTLYDLHDKDNINYQFLQYFTVFYIILQLISLAGPIGEKDFACSYLPLTFIL